MISPICIMISPTVLKFQRMVSPTVLNIPHGTEHPTVLKITPHSTHDIPHSTEHPPWYSRYPPTFIMISHHGTEHPPRYCTHIIQGAFAFLLFLSSFISFKSVDTKEMTILHSFLPFLTICVLSSIQLAPKLIPCFCPIFTDL